jgi:hypothetical protein
MKVFVFDLLAYGENLDHIKVGAERIIAAADAAGANMVQVGLNRGAMPHEIFIEQIRRFARDVLPILQAHEVARVPAAERAAA